MLDSLHTLMTKFKIHLPKEERKDFPLILPKSWIDALENSQALNRRLTSVDSHKSTIGMAYAHSEDTHEFLYWEIVEEALQKAEKYDILMKKED